MPYPNIRPEIFTIPQVHLGGLALGPFSVRWYALAYIAGILIGWRYAVGLVRNARLWGGARPVASPAQIDDFIVWVTLGIILGGRIGYVLFYMLPLASQRAVLAANPLEIFEVWHGGMSFHGGAIGVLIALFFFVRRQRLNFLSLADVAAASVPFGLFFGRIANFINGELWGRVTNVPWAMVFCGPYIPTYPDGTCIAGDQPRHPSQLYEAALEGVALFCILRLATHRFCALRRPGVVTGLFLAFYGIFRIALENVRMPDAGLRHLPLSLTVGMLLSVPMVILGAWLVHRGVKRGPSPAAVEIGGPAKAPESC
ncbi:MAG: prolipoprotein diacylglyceryl transferase [Caulobacteraceae bacterium]